MKRPFLVLALLFSASLPAQAPTAVSIPQEPHHHLVLENAYVRVFRVSVPAHESTLLHQHDVPYLYVSLGPADVINAVQGKPERRNILWLVLTGSLKLIMTGIFAGLLGAWAIARLLMNNIFGVTPNTLDVYAVSVAVLGAAVLLATLVPLRRATRVDPLIVLRCE